MPLPSGVGMFVTCLPYPNSIDELDKPFPVPPPFIAECRLVNTDATP
jgi:hypothetical protein